MAAIALMSLPGSMSAQERKDYSFSRSETPEQIKSYSNTVFTASAHDVATMRGDLLGSVGSKNVIKDFEVSPAGNTYVLIYADKKGVNKGEGFDATAAGVRKFKFDAKKLGTPTAAAYTPDSRELAVATDKGIVLLETKKFKPVGKIDLVPVEAKDMVFSPNGYFLALVDGKDVVIYNYESKKIRHRIDAEVPVNDVAFSKDSQQMAVLSSDGLVSVYDTRTFDVRTMLDDLGDGLACDFNDNGKYLAVAGKDDVIRVVNLVRTSDKREYASADPGLTDVIFITDAILNPLMVYGAKQKLNARRMLDLEPFYSRLVSENADERMAEWMKMQPGESLADYQKRVTDESRARQRRLYEDEISTQLAGDMLAMSEITLGNYDRNNEVLQVEFSNLPSIWLPVASGDAASFVSGKDLSVSEAQYGVLPDDSFELIYAKFLNRNDNKTYVYNNLDRKPMEMLGGDADFVSLDIIRQQQMEELKLQEVKQQVIEEAKHNNVISDHTNITVDSRVQPDYDADGNKILNYIVKFTYEVEPEFSAVEDFASGKYLASQSGAASSMLKIVKQAFEGELSQYMKPGKRLKVNLSGTADAAPILRPLTYGGEYGDFEDEPVNIDGALSTLTVTKRTGIPGNEQLAFLRAAGVKDFLTKEVKALNDMDPRYNYEVSVSKDKGGAHRRITAEFVFVDAF